MDLTEILDRAKKTENIEELSKILDDCQRLDHSIDKIFVFLIVSLKITFLKFVDLENRVSKIEKGDEHEHRR